MVRPVHIRHEPAKHAIFVLYSDREKGQRYLAAQFDDRTSTLERVTSYVRSRADLRLVCAISGTDI